MSEARLSDWLKALSHLERKPLSTWSGVTGRHRETQRSNGDVGRSSTETCKWWGWGVLLKVPERTTHTGAGPLSSLAFDFSLWLVP